MALQHHNYSKLIGLLKVFLPITALLLLGTVFLLTGDDGYDPGFTFTQAEFDALEQGSFIDNSNINGRTIKGDIFSLVADRIEPDGQKLTKVFAYNLISTFDFVSGGSAQIIADQAQIINANQMLLFPDGANISTSDGYDGLVENMSVNLKSGEITGEVIDADGPIGQVSAEIFHISSVLVEDGENRVLSFEKNVNVVLNTPTQAE